MPFLKNPSDPRTRRTLLWQWAWRRPIVRRFFYEFLGLIVLRKRRFRVLNCGYSEVDYPAISLGADSETERLGLQLYHRLVRSVSLTGADVLEVGCGRGGGAQFLAETYAPRSYWATDLSWIFIGSARLRRRSPGLRFRFAQANHLPFRAHSFDIGLSVESVHLLHDKAAFLQEMARVLRPGGRLLIADFFYARDSSPSALTSFRKTIVESGLELDTEENWTKQAIEALEADSPKRLAEIHRLPRVFRELAISFASTVVSPLYQQLRDGRAMYVHFELSIPATFPERQTTRSDDRLRQPNSIQAHVSLGM